MLCGTGGNTVEDEDDDPDLNTKGDRRNVGVNEEVRPKEEDGALVSDATAEAIFRNERLHRGQIVDICNHSSMHLT
jgi:hypothetical protein